MHQSIGFTGIWNAAIPWYERRFPPALHKVMIEIFVLTKFKEEFPSLMHDK